jgi:hypothetical protein
MIMKIIRDIAKNVSYKNILPQIACSYMNFIYIEKSSVISLD